MEDLCAVKLHGEGVLKPEQVILTFQEHPCCTRANCVVTLCGLPAPTDGYCATCFHTNQYCDIVGASGVSSGSFTEERFSDNQRKAAFLNIVNIGSALGESARRHW